MTTLPPSFAYTQQPFVFVQSLVYIGLNKKYLLICTFDISTSFFSFTTSSTAILRQIHITENFANIRKSRGISKSRNTRVLHRTRSPIFFFKPQSRLPHTVPYTVHRPPITFILPRETRLATCFISRQPIRQMMGGNHCPPSNRSQDLHRPRRRTHRCTTVFPYHNSLACLPSRH